MPPPIISLAGLDAADPAARAAVVDALRTACLDKGFFYIVDHGVPPALIRAVFDQSRVFFDLPMAAKLAVDKARSPCNRGYEPLRGQVLEAGSPPDLKEGFYIGTDLGPGDPRVAAGLFNHGPNQWPSDLPLWRGTMEFYFERMLGLCRTVMRALALGLNLPEDHFDGFCDDAVATLRLLHYPPQPANPAPGEKGCGAHTDFGAITLLAQDEVGGLEVWDGDNGWMPAPPVPGAFVVNLGDLMARWTNDRYRSTLHRVINASGRERYSIPFFFTGRADYPVTCLEACLAPGETPKYPPTTAIGHLEEMYQRTYASA
jgi:isopenicillin N synthase-like dioxygenase